MLEPARYLHRAPFVAPMASASPAAVIEDGAVLTEHGTIKEVGDYAALKGADAELVEHENRILTPALINCHAHLELSHLFALGQQQGPETPGDITGWIRKLLAARLEAGLGEEQTFVAWQALGQLYAGGCGAVADIGNLPESYEIGANFKVRHFFFQEFLGFSEESSSEALELLKSMEDNHFCTAHAPYSTNGKLIANLKKRAARLGHLFPVHVAESADEVTFLKTGQGPFRDFLEERQVWEDSFVVPGMGAVSYLDKLQVLDAKTLCVHCVQVTDEEIEILAQRNAGVCLCPASNRYMGVGMAPVSKMLEHGIMPVLGTDSLASNARLSMWREMRMLMEDHPGLDPEAVFTMATRRGAEVLGVDDDMGLLAPGRSASFLAVATDVRNAGEVFDFLVYAGLDVQLEWVE